MNYIIASNYRIDFYDFTQLEKKFIKFTNYQINTFPFRWQIFSQKIMRNRISNFKKDSTLIVSLLDLELEDVEILFLILKEYLRASLIKKIIYKKEFIIVHFFSNRTLDIIASPNLWTSISYFFTLQELYGEENVFFKAVIYAEDTVEEIDIVLLNDDKVYLFSSLKQLKIPLDANYHFINICHEMYRNDNIINVTNKLPFSFYRLIRYNNIAKLMCQLNNPFIDTNLNISDLI